MVAKKPRSRDISRQAECDLRHDRAPQAADQARRAQRDVERQDRHRNRDSRPSVKKFNGSSRPRSCIRAKTDATTSAVVTAITGMLLESCRQASRCRSQAVRAGG
jgi:hypothetical protein